MYFSVKETVLGRSCCSMIIKFSFSFKKLDKVIFAQQKKNAVDKNIELFNLTLELYYKLLCEH